MHREFDDAQGHRWQVWEVIPTFAQRRHRPDIVAADGRTVKGLRSSIPVDMHEGWLAFATTGERRRLAPTPLGWELLSDRELVELLERAVPAGPARRLIE